MQRAEDADLAAPLATGPWTQDRRLQAAAAVVESGRIEVLTLDVFDTMVWRSVREPVDAFLLLGERLRDQGILTEDFSPEVFAHLRCRAEALARTKVAPVGGAQEIPLEAIYHQMPDHLFVGVPPAAVVELEVALEAEITHPDLDIVAFATRARELHGVRVAAVSDTYFSSEQLRRVLAGPPAVALELDRVFTSSDHGVGKGFGLFGRVLADLEVKPDAVLHIGDHPISDVQAPGALGIHVVHFEKFPPTEAKVIEREVATTEHFAAYPPSASDIGITALRSKVLARTSQDANGAAVRNFWRCGAAILGPVVTGFAEWVHDYGTKQGVDTAYCLMREGEFVARVLDGARSHVAAPLRAEKLWASRHVTARAGILEASTEELVTFLHRRNPPTLRQFLEGLGLSLSDVPELFASANGRLHDEVLLARVLEVIERRPELRASIVASSSALRDRLVTSIVNKVGDAKRMLVVDLGWGGTIQHNLQRVLEASGVEIEVLGAYLMTNEAAVDRVLGGMQAAAYLANVGIPKGIVSLVSRSPEIIEQVFMHDVGTLQDFTPQGEPVCAVPQQRPVQMLQRTAVQNGILDFQREWSRYHDGAAPTATGSMLEPPARRTMLEILHRFLTRPTTDEAAMFASWLHDDNFGSSDSESVLNPELAKLVRYMTPDQYLALPSTRTFWPYGLATLYDQPLADATAAISSGTVVGQAFNRSERHFMPVYIDDGSGYQERLRTPTQVNGAGLCFASVSLDARAVHALRLAFPGGAGVVRLDWLRMDFHLRGASSPTTIVLEVPEDFENVSFEHCRRIGSNVLLGAKQAPQLVYTCSPEWRDEVFSVRVEAAFGWLPFAGTPTAEPTIAPGGKILRRSAARAIRRTRSLLDVEQGR